MREPFVIADHSIAPGMHQMVSLPAAQLFTNTPLDLPIHVHHGKLNGPTVFITAAIHGDEINGVEIIRRLHNLRAIQRIKGTLITVPIVNQHGFLLQSRYLPDRRDLNRSFPGNQKGSLASRLAHLITNEIVKRCDYGIDLHTGAVHRSNLPQVRYTKGRMKAKKLAQSFNAPIMLHASIRDGSLRATAANLDIPMIVYEAGEALRFDEIAIKVGLNGILNVLHNLEMIKHHVSARGVKVEGGTPFSKLVKSSHWIRAPISGMVYQPVKLGKPVSQGECIATIVDPYGSVSTKVVAPYEGLIIGKSNIPLVNEGDGLFHIASFKNIKVVARQVDDLHSGMSGDLALF